MSDSLLGSGVAADTDSTTLLLNSLISARHSGRRIYLNAFQRSGEILHHFGHRLHRLGFHVHTLDPWSIIEYPQVQDVIITLSGSLQTEPVIVTLLHADREGLYRFVITAQPTEETRKRFQGVLPVHISGAPDPASEPEIRKLLPLAYLFELRTFLYLEALLETLGCVIEAGGSVSGDASPQAPSPALMCMLAEVRKRAPETGAIMRALVAQYQAALEQVADDQLEGLLRILEATAREGRATYITGYGRNNEIGGLFAHRLAGLGLPVSLTPTRLERPSQKGDCLLALTGAGNTYEVLQRMSGARRGGLRTAVITAVADSPVTQFADAVVIVPAAIEPRYTSHVAKSRGTPIPPPLPTASTFGLNTLLTLEALAAVLMQRLEHGEPRLSHADPWQGY